LTYIWTLSYEVSRLRPSTDNTRTFWLLQTLPHVLASYQARSIQLRTKLSPRTDPMRFLYTHRGVA